MTSCFELGLEKPNLLSKSSSGMKNASGAEDTGIDFAVGIRPVWRSSPGSRTSMRIRLDDGCFESSWMSWNAYCVGALMPDVMFGSSLKSLLSTEKFREYAGAVHTA